MLRSHTRRHKIGVRLLVTTTVFVALLSASTLAQPNRFVGTWELIARTTPQGVVDQDPHELLVFTDAGIYVRIELPKGRPRVNKPDAELTLEELRARYKGVIAFHGTYRVTGDRLTAEVVAHTDPNREGIMAVRKITVEDDTLTLSSATNPAFPAVSRYRRIRDAGRSAVASEPG
jgi:hypothetical protein